MSNPLSIGTTFPVCLDICLLMALRRLDVWPSGDLALAVAAQRVKRLKTRLTPDELDAIGATWQPWRAIAARVLWHYYLSDQTRSVRRLDASHSGV